jgi:hypothetical protein
VGVQADGLGRSSVSVWSSSRWRPGQRATGDGRRWWPPMGNEADIYVDGEDPHGDRRQVEVEPCSGWRRAAPATPVVLGVQRCWVE